MSRRRAISRGQALAVATALVRTIRNENVGFLAAAVAYYSFVSLIPLLLIGFAIGSVVGGEAIAAAVIDAVGGLLAPAGEDLIRSALLGARGRSGATVVGLALLLWSGLRLFRGLDAAFSRVYGIDVAENVLVQIKDALTVLGSIAIGLVAVILIGGLLPAVTGVLGHLVAIVSLPIVLVVAFFPMYYTFPDVAVSPREAVPGAVFAAVSWSLLVGVFRIYAGVAGQYDLYGVLGAVLLLVTWLYIAAIVIIFGGVLNAVLAGRADETVRGTENGPLRTDGGREAAEAPSDDRDDLESELDDLRTYVEERTLDREELEADLRGYVRRRIRRGHARGWGPYLVLLYGTVMTIGAFVYLSGGWAILAMLIIWLSTLGLYALMLIVGLVFRAVETPGRAADWVRRRRE